MDQAIVSRARRAPHVLEEQAERRRAGAAVIVR
jgi:hypothetical protein